MRPRLVDHPGSVLSLAVHPEQFYLMANGLLVSVLVSAMWRRTRGRPGSTFVAFLITYGATRSWWEFFREPTAAGATALLSASQWMCLVLVGAGIIAAGARAFQSTGEPLRATGGGRRLVAWPRGSTLSAPRSNRC